MAQLIPYQRKNGTTYGVKWRRGGSGKTEHETFKGENAEKNAKFFKADVERCGHQYPPNFIPKFGYVDPHVLAEEKARLAAEDARAAAASPVYFKDRYQTFLGALSGIEERTVKDYHRQFTNHLLPAFGDLIVNDAAAGDAVEDAVWTGDKVKTWVNHLDRGLPDPVTGKWIVEPRAPKTIRNLHALLSSYGAWIVDKELRATNPCTGTRLPEPEDGDADLEMVFLEREEYALLRECFGEQEAKDLADFLVGTGARYGEATALKIKDLNLDPPRDTPHFRVRRAWKRQPNGSHRLGKPKSRASRRRVELEGNDHILAMLRRVTAGRGPEEFVFLTPTGVYWRHANFYNRPWLQAVYKAVRCVAHRRADGIRNMHNLKRRHAVPCGCDGTLRKVPRIHDLRHTNAAWLIEAGVSLLAVQRQFGHESYHTTEKRYGHLTALVRASMGAAITAAFGGAAAIGRGVAASASTLATRYRRQNKRHHRRQRMLLASGLSAAG